MKTIILTGGGTGGHVIPHLSLIPFIKKDFDKIVYIGTKPSIENDIMKNVEGVIFEEITASKFRRDKKLSLLSLPFKVAKSTCQAKKILKKYRPDVVFSKGGYVSVPVCIASKMLKIPIVSHESDLSMGLSNKIIYRLCTTFCTTFDSTTKNLKKAVFTGPPIRRELFFGDSNKGLELTSISPENFSKKPTILFTGGSTGAESLNNIVFDNIGILTRDFNIVHLVGKKKSKKLPNTDSYTQIEYCDHIEHLFAMASVVVSRSGSNVIFELLALNKPMILIPLSNSASRGDQVDNAKYFEEKQYAKVIFEESLTIQKLVSAIKEELQKTKDNNTKKDKIKTSLSQKKEIDGTKNIYLEILKATKR